MTETFFCGSCAKHRPAHLYAKKRPNGVKQCTTCEARAIAGRAKAASDVVGHYPDGEPRLRKHQEVSLRPTQAQAVRERVGGQVLRQGRHHVTPELRAALTGTSDYDDLPDSLKGIYTLQQWLWLSDAQKGQLLQTETEPEWSEP